MGLKNPMRGSNPSDQESYEDSYEGSEDPYSDYEDSQEYPSEGIQPQPADDYDRIVSIRGFYPKPKKVSRKRGRRFIKNYSVTRKGDPTKKKTSWLATNKSLLRKAYTKVLMTVSDKHLLSKSWLKQNRIPCWYVRTPISELRRKRRLRLANLLVFVRMKNILDVSGIKTPELPLNFFSGEAPGMYFCRAVAKLIKHYLNATVICPHPGKPGESASTR